MILLYISIFISFLFSSLSILFMLFTKFPIKFKKILFLKNISFFPKLIISSQKLYFNFFGNLSFKLIDYITHISGIILLFGVIFRMCVYFQILQLPFFVNFSIFLLIACNTVFRSLITFSIFVNQTSLFLILLHEQFFSNIITKPFWKNEIYYLLLCYQQIFNPQSNKKKHNNVQN